MTDSYNTVQQLLAREEEKEQRRLEIIGRHLDAGVFFFDFRTAYIDPDVKIGEGTRIGAGVVLSGATAIGSNCWIGHHARLEDSVVGNDVSVEQSVVIQSYLGDRSKVGPFAYLRPGSRIGEDAKVGDFVEIKNSVLGKGSKVSHLTYIGDADVGDGVNIGCGVVFVNYDGREKHRSVVEDGAFIGCNTNLISPVLVGEGSYVAAGTTVTKNVPAGALCIGRQPARCIEGWVKKREILTKKTK